MTIESVPHSYQAKELVSAPVFADKTQDFMLHPLFEGGPR